MKKKKAVEAVPENDDAALTAPLFSAASVDEASKLVDQAVAAINPGGPGMTTTDRRRTTKIRTGGEKFIPLLAELAATYGITSPVHTIDEMSSLLEQVQKLVPLQRRVEVLLKLVEDTDLQANSDMWSAATFVYSVLKRMAKRDGNIALALEPLAEFFSNGKSTATAGTKGTGKQAITTTTSTTPATVEAQPALAAVVTPPHA
jgi:hypothetical protein